MRPIILASVFAVTANANNITVSNIALTDLDTVGDTVNVKFDVTWENGWRLTTLPANWDAAWVFVKFHAGDIVWRHASLDTADVNHTAPAGAIIKVGLTDTRGIGVFLHRASPGTGTTTFTNVKLKWRYGLDAVPDDARVTVDVTGIEMVYIPQGAFRVGDGASPTDRLGDSMGDPFLITSAGSIQCGTQAGALSRWNNSQTLSPGSTYLNVPTTFPNGFNGFYCMKYEPSQGERAAAANKGGPPVVTISGEGQTFAGQVGSLSSTSPDRAYAGVSNDCRDELGYLDWAGLRPMTEMEYEKACRGPQTPVPGEYACGSAFITNSSYTIANPGTATEAIATGYRNDAGNVWIVNTRNDNRAARVGIFAVSSYTGPASPRLQSGAGYYGVYEMTGNVWDAVIRFTFRTTPGFLFASAHGDGAIGLTGYHNVPEWGNSGLIGADTGINTSVKGGAHNTGALSVSSGLVNSSVVSPRITVRGVRSAP